MTITLTGDKVPGQCISLHEFLAKKVLLAAQSEASGRNVFSCAFLFSTNQGRNIVVNVDAIEPTTVDVPSNFSKILHRRIDTEMSGLPATVVRKAKDFKGNIQQSKLLSCDVSEQVFQKGCFFNSTQLPLFVFQKEASYCAKDLLDNVSSYQSQDVLQKLFFSYILTVISRSQPMETENVKRFGDSAHYCIYNTDSESHALYVLSKMVNRIAAKVKNRLGADEKIQRIEFHGCSTRDLCPLCYTNMNCVQFLANKKQNFGILGALLDVFKTMDCADDSCETATFISSLQEFQSVDNTANPLWDLDESITSIVPGFVYQFRLSNAEIGKIMNTNEQALRAGVAGMVDLSSIPMDLEEMVPDSGTMSIDDGSTLHPAPIIPPKETQTHSHSTAETPAADVSGNDTLVELQLARAGYRLQNVPGDGNCAFWSILVAQGKISDEELGKLMEAYESLKTELGYSPNWSDCKDVLRKAAPEAVEKMIQLRNSCGLGDVGKWEKEEDLRGIASVIENPIVLVQVRDGTVTYTLYATENAGTNLTGPDVEQIFEVYKDALFIYHNDSHFQAIVPLATH